MPTLRTIHRTALGTLAAGVLLTHGCSLPHAPLRPPGALGALTPQQYCPNDTLTASFDTLSGSSCMSHSGMDCAALAPTIQVRSGSGAFPDRSFNSYAGRLDFTPTGDSETVTFSGPSDPFSFLYPVIRTTGERSFESRMFATTTRTANMISGEVAQTIEHGGMCAGSGMQVHADGVLSAQVSPNAVLRRICNDNADTIFVIVPGASGGAAQRMLGPGGCFDTTEPGVPAGVGAARSYSVRATALDPNAQCSPLQQMTPPRALRTRAFFGCPSG